ncbi:MAG: TIGR00266 family protein [Eubacterium sp.]|nr:TIGR00266 family protein [Eubacterium sp.]
MKYEIEGGNLPAVIVELSEGETIYTESGGMAWMDDCFSMETNTRGGVLKAFKRSFSGQSMFMTTYTCHKDGGRIAFCSSFPGNIKVAHLEEGQSIICQKRSFLAAEASVDLSIFFKKSLKTGFFGGEGFILQKITGPGLVFLEMDGSIVEYELTQGQVLNVDQGHIAMFEPSVSFDITQVKGVKNVLFSGEGLFMGRLEGPGRVWLQTMPFSKIVDEVIAKVPTSS